MHKICTNLKLWKGYYLRYHENKHEPDQAMKSELEDLRRQLQERDKKCSELSQELDKVSKEKKELESVMQCTVYRSEGGEKPYLVAKIASPDKDLVAHLCNDLNNLHIIDDYTNTPSSPYCSYHDEMKNCDTRVGSRTRIKRRSKSLLLLKQQKLQRERGLGSPPYLENLHGTHPYHHTPSLGEYDDVDCNDDEDEEWTLCSNPNNDDSDRYVRPRDDTIIVSDDDETEACEGTLFLSSSLPLPSPTLKEPQQFESTAALFQCVSEKKKKKNQIVRKGPVRTHTQIRFCLRARAIHSFIHYRLHFFFLHILSNNKTAWPSCSGGGRILASLLF